MNNILRIISELQQSTYAYIGVNASCQNYLRSLRYIDELQKFVEDNQWKRSLAIEPNQLKADHQENAKESQEVMSHLNLSPSKNGLGKTSDQLTNHPTHRPFIPGHRRAKSDGCGMFMMSARKHEVIQADNYKANYSHHLLDDSKLDEEPLTYSRPGSPHTLPPDLRCSLRKGNMAEKSEGPGAVMKILRNPGIKCQHQVLLSFKILVEYLRQFSTL